MTSASSNSQIAIIGSSSMVGSRFAQLWQNKTQLISAELSSTPSIDLTKKGSVQEFFNTYEFETAILFSAFTDVDQAELQRNDKNGSCWKINVDGVRNVAKSCKEKKVKLIFISTDFVFDGQNGPYKEDDSAGPNMDQVSWYGISKLEGEKIVEELEDFIILRISYPYRAYFQGKEDFFKKSLSLYSENKLYPMFDDQTMTPTFIDDVAPALQLLLESDRKGVFHLASPTPGTPYEIIKNLIKTFGGDPKVVEKGSIIEFLKNGDKTPRPVKGGLIVDKIEKLGFVPTSWKKGIEQIYIQSKGKLI